MGTIIFYNRNYISWLGIKPQSVVNFEFLQRSMFWNYGNFRYWTKHNTLMRAFVLFHCFISCWFVQFLLHVKKEIFEEKIALVVIKTRSYLNLLPHIIIITIFVFGFRVWLLLENFELSRSHEIVIQPNKIWFLFNGYLRTSFFFLPSGNCPSVYISTKPKNSFYRSIITTNWILIYNFRDICHFH